MHPVAVLPSLVYGEGVGRVKGGHQMEATYECPCCAATFDAEESPEVTCPECGRMFSTEESK